MRRQPSLLLISTASGGMASSRSAWPITSSASPAPYFPAESNTTSGLICVKNSLTIASFSA